MANPEIKHVDLEIIKLSALKYISREFVECFAIPPEVRVVEDYDFMWNDIVVQIKQKVFSQRLEEIKYPADWWQHTKERFAPEWIKRRWPVRYCVHDIRALYSMIALPKERHSIAVINNYNCLEGE